MDETGNQQGHAGNSRAAYVSMAMRMHDAGWQPDQIAYFGRLWENAILSGVPPGIQEAARREYKMIYDEAAKLPAPPSVTTEDLQKMARALDAKADPNQVYLPTIGAGSWGKYDTAR